MDYEAFVDDVMAQAQFGGPSAAKRAIQAVLRALGEALPPRVAHEVAAGLPADMARALRDVSGEGARTESDFYARIGEWAGLSLSQGLEQAQIVCAVLAKRLDDSVKQRLLRELPDPLALLFSEVERPIPTLPARTRLSSHTLATSAPGSRHALSSTAPGSLHPLSEAAPRGAQSHSVDEVDPHEDSKLSSARGFMRGRGITKPSAAH